MQHKEFRAVRGSRAVGTHGLAVHEAVGERFAQHRRLIEDAERRLEHRVEEAVAGRPVPQSVQARAQPVHQLEAPVHDALALQLYTNRTVL